MDQNVQSKRLCGPKQTPALPDDILERILGLLDARSLCTARLINKDFCRVASGHVRAVHLPSTALERPPSSTFAQLSGLKYAAVSVASEEQLQMLAHPGIAPVITHVNLTFIPLPEGQLSLLPNLREVSLYGELQGLLPPSVEAVQFKVPIRKKASWLTGLSGLRSLKIHLAAGAWRSLGRLTCLQNLRFLGLQCGTSAMRVISTFTGLTALEWDVIPSRGSAADIVRSVACLTGLSHLAVVDRGRKLSIGQLAPLSHLINLTHLDFSHTLLDKGVRGSSFLVPLTGLVSLGLNCNSVGISLLPSLDVEALQSLTLRCATGDVSVLQRATGLTQLAVIGLGPEIPQGLEPALASMTGLRSLSLQLRDSRGAPVPLRLSEVLPSLKSLKHLVYSGQFTAGTDLSACADLPSLHYLGLSSVPEVTPAWLPTLQAMSGLDELALVNTGVHMEHVTPEVRAAFDADGCRRGWPRLRLSIDSNDV